MPKAQRRDHFAPDHFSVKVVPLGSVSDEDTVRWRALVDRAIEPNVYLDPRFLLPNAHLHPDTSDIRVALVERGDALVGAFQFSIRRIGRPIGMPVATTAGLFMRKLGGRQYPLIGTDDPVGTLRALFRAHRQGPYPRLLDLRRFPAEGPLFDAFEQALREERMESTELLRRECAFVYPPTAGTPPEQEIFDFSPLSSRRRYLLRKGARWIEEETGEKLRVVDLASDDDVVDRFLRLQAAGWKGDTEKGGEAVLLDSSHERWYREVAARFKQDGELLAPTLMAGEQIVHMALNFRSGGRVFGSYDAFDERFARSMPGSLGRLAEWRYTRDVHGAATQDPVLEWYHEDATKLYPDRRPFVDLLVANRGLASVAVLKALPHMPRIRHGVMAARGASQHHDQ